MNKLGDYFERSTPSTVYGSHTIPLVRLSDAEAIIAQKDAEILDQCRLNGMGAEREAALLGQIERLKTEISKCYAAFNPSDRFKKRLIELHEEQSTALKLAREALMHDGYPCGNGCKCRACEALAAIDEVLKGE